jgi:hypothetical protein
MTERYLDDFAVQEKLSRRSLVARATFFGAAMAAIGEAAKAQDAGSGSYSNAAIALPDPNGAAKPARANSRRQDRARHGAGRAPLPRTPRSPRWISWAAAERS